MPVIGAFILPHPPIILPEIGQGEERKLAATAAAFRAVADKIKELAPETIVLTSPHSILYADYFHLSPGGHAKGDFSSFRAPSLGLSVTYDTAYVKKLTDVSNDHSIPAGTMGERNAALDHGTMIPLMFINEVYQSYKLVRIGLSGMTMAEHYRFGMCIRDAADALGRKIVVIASGDLSHKVRADGPYGYAEEGVLFDRQITEAMATGDFLRFMTFDQEVTEKAAECGLRSCVVMAGALDGTAVDSQLLSYEGTFGVGYGVASFIPCGNDSDRHFLNQFLQREERQLAAIRNDEDDYVRLARQSVETYVTTKKPMVLPGGLKSELLNSQAGVFVSLKKHGQLRGCIGTISPVTGSVAEEILRNSISAATEDPRFEQVRPDELRELVYSVDVLSPPEPVSSEAALDVTRYGVIVSSGRRRGLLLPNLDGVDTVAEQVAIARQKAGIQPNEQVQLERFEVVRHK